MGKPTGSPKRRIDWEAVGGAIFTLLFIAAIVAVILFVFDAILDYADEIHAAKADCLSHGYTSSVITYAADGSAVYYCKKLEKGSETVVPLEELRDE